MLALKIAMEMNLILILIKIRIFSFLNSLNFPLIELNLFKNNEIAVTQGEIAVTNH